MLSLSSPVAKFASKHRRSFGDSVLFQVHYVLTAGILLTFVFIYCAKDFIGDPIRCMYSKSLPEDARKLIETFCYINGLYTVQNPEDINGPRVSYNKDYYLYPGVQQYIKGRHIVKRHSYYAWSGLFIFFLAVLFYAPRYIWKKIDDGNISKFSQKLDKVIAVKDMRSSEFEELSQHFASQLGYHTRHIVLFHTCELLNILVTIVSMLMTDMFLSYGFFDYGWEVLKDIINNNYDDFNRPMAMVKHFPTISKCEFRQSGVSGSVEILDMMCVLPLNNVNEKVYLFLWFYFILLTAASLLWMAFWRLMPIISFRVRRKFIMDAVGKLPSQSERSAVSDFVKQLRYADWLVLYKLRSQMDAAYYRTFVGSVAKYHNERVFYEGDDV